MTVAPIADARDTTRRACSPAPALPMAPSEADEPEQGRVDRKEVIAASAGSVACGQSARGVMTTVTSPAAVAPPAVSEEKVRSLCFVTWSV